MARVTFYFNRSNEVLEKLKQNPTYFDLQENKLPIYMGVTFAHKRIRISTRLYVNPNNFDAKKKKVSNREPFASYINDMLVLMEEKVFKLDLSSKMENKPLTIDYVKKELTKFIDSMEEETVTGKDTETFFLKTFDEFLENSTDKTESTIRNYRNTLNQLKRFAKKHDQSLRFSSFNKVFIDKLLRYYFKDLRITRNTAGKHIKNLKAFLKDSYLKELHSNRYFEQLEVFKDMGNIIYLTADEVKALRDVNLPDRTLQEIRDFFLFGVYSGLRYSDISKINKSLVEGDFLIFTSQKSKKLQRTYINKFAKPILEKYDFSLPSYTLQTVNEYIKRIAKQAGLNREVTRVRFVGSERREERKFLHEVISTHCAKKTFVTNFFQLGGRLETIMQSTGNTDRETMKHYLKFTGEGQKREMDDISDRLDY